MKKQILILAAIGIISLSAGAYAQSDNSTPPNEPYAGGNEDNQAKKRENTRETSHERKRTEQPEEQPESHSGR